MFSSTNSFSFPFSEYFWLQKLSGSFVYCISNPMRTFSREQWAIWKSWLGSTLISTGSILVLFTLSAFSGRASDAPELLSFPELCSSLNSGPISLSSKGKSNSTLASTFDLGVLLVQFFFQLRLAFLPEKLRHQLSKFHLLGRPLLVHSKGLHSFCAAPMFSW